SHLPEASPCLHQLSGNLCVPAQGDGISDSKEACASPLRGKASLTHGSCLLRDKESVTHGSCLLRHMFVPEEYGEQNRNHQRISCKGKPYSLPVKCSALQDEVFVNHYSADAAAKKCPETVGHHHEKSLGTCTDVRSALGFHEERTGNIEEIKCHAVNDAR